ncbi:hypothetical protein CALVIDRAFT_564573 [Calocera viscosa TUFC12733]|uniref:Uncharacterized protein n=1 Tax=Calocera viscosa (strain TUFC12733) TaxID=1330018 RepID=A0A167LBJ0_CALVF|nr:hypothetical protein CALVIDRAFT_564573 [Calocera viscosa TUFC12733]
MARPRSNAAVREKLAKVCPDVPEDLPVAPDHGNWFYMLDSTAPTPPGSRSSSPAFRIHQGFTPSDRVLSLIKKFYNTSPRSTRDTGAAQTRSTYPALYMGVWRRSSLVPFITADATKQKPATLDAMDELLRAVDEEVGKRVLQLLGANFPQVAKERDEIIKHTWDHAALSNIQRSALHQRAWLCLALRCGGGNVVHIDMNDDADQYTVLFTYGDFKMGYLVLPQLNIRIPLQPGQLLFIKTRILAHYVYHFTGIRYVFTGFMDATLCKDYRKYASS